MIFILGVFTPIDLAERLSFAVNFPDPFDGQVGGVNRGKLSDTDTIPLVGFRVNCIETLLLSFKNNINIRRVYSGLRGQPAVAVSP